MSLRSLTKKIAQMTMCMGAGPPLLDERGRGSTKGQRNPTTSAVFILAASRYAQSNLVSFFFLFFFFSTDFFFFWCVFGLYASFHGR